jgi:phytanoyl-CoA hydroxylase
MSLTFEQMQCFRHNGFLKLPGRLPATMVEGLKEAIRKDIREEVKPVVRDRNGRIVRISNIWDRAAIFREAVTCSEVLSPLVSLLGPNVELIRNRHNHACLRLADDGSDYTHRDNMQWSRAIVSVLFYLEETTVENGCTLVIPGTHLFPGLSSPRLPEDEAVVRSGLLDQAVPVPMPAGGMLALDGLLFHTAGKNHTDGTRISLTMGYHSVDELTDLVNPKRVLIAGDRPYMGNDR